MIWNLRRLLGVLRLLQAAQIIRRPLGVRCRREHSAFVILDRYSYDREKRDALGAWCARLQRIVAGNDGLNVVSIAGPAFT